MKHEVIVNLRNYKPELKVQIITNLFFLIAVFNFLAEFHSPRKQPVLVNFYLKSCVFFSKSGLQRILI